MSVLTGTGGAPACTAVDAGSCKPANVASFTPTTPPPAAASPVCTSTEIQTIYNDCYGPDGTCPEANEDDPCYTCIFTFQNAASWGPVVQSPDGLGDLNFGGCLLLLEPCNTACAATFENDLECEQAACAASCPLTADAATVTSYSDCANAVDSCDPGGCFQYWNGTSCYSEITGAAHPGAICFAAGPSDFEGSFLNIADVFCGNGS